MTWIDFLPDNVRQHPANFVGPNVAGVIVQALETGILINQSVRFWSRLDTEPRVVKAIVILVSCVAAFQTIIAVYNTWIVIVLGFGDVELVVNLRWPDRIQPALNCVMATPFQAFLIWQCWTVLHRRWVILAPLVTLLLATVIMNIYITIDVFYKFRTPITSLETFLTGPPNSYITAFVLTAVLDMLMTALMMWYLLRCKSQVVSRRLAKTLGQLHRLVWEAAIPPSACAIAACVAYITSSQKNLWDIFFQTILGKLYVISLFVMLNGRVDLKRSRREYVSTQTLGMSRYWARDAPVQFRVDLTSAIDLHASSDIELGSPTRRLADGHRLKSSIGSCDYDQSRNNGRRQHVASDSATDIQDDGGGTSTGSFVTIPPTVLHRSNGSGDGRLSC